jgi:pyrimidine-nucleoside phosphorylase
MLSGRGLGHTGGTLDKLESIPGFRTDLSLDEFARGVEKVGCVISGQTLEIAPADKMMYALRDVTATVESIPLICSSILSKKFAAGPHGLVFDIKCGSGAFMKTLDDAESLAGNLIEVCRAMSRKARAIITDMNQPLGYAAGNLLEVVEAIEALKGNFPPDLHTVTLELAIEMLLMSGIAEERGEAILLLEEKISDGSAYRKFVEMVDFQGGDLSIFDARGDFPVASQVRDFQAAADGYITGFETEGIGRLIVDMGGGRKTKDDKIDNLVGIIFRKKTGDPVKAGESVAVVHSNDSRMAKHAAERLQTYVKIGGVRVSPPQLIKKRVS